MRALDQILEVTFTTLERHHPVVAAAVLLGIIFALPFTPAFN